MAVDQQNVSKILSVLSHPLRREILLTLSEKSECSFTDLLNALKIDTGKLSFHLRALSAFVEQTPMAKYRLSRAGENAVRVIKDVESWAEAADVGKKATHLPLASFRKRAYAFLIDFSLILAITLVIMLPQVISFLSGNVFTIGLSAVIFGTLGLLWVYSTLLEGFNGQSLGKRVIGLKVVRTDGKKATYDQAAVRNFGKAFLLPIDLIAGLRIKNAEFLRYFDRFAGTTVIDLRHQLS
ncbi:MAG: RDD family protein [Candidatus Bathyarchaeota archaeon]|nr:RDD family protein [Candidatus Bathyarchaeota archaeon]